MKNVINLQQGFPTVAIGGFETVVATADELAECMVNDCLNARKAAARNRRIMPRLVFSSNGQGVSLAANDAKFAATMQKADIIHADGMSVVFASRLKRTPLPERVSTTDFFHNAARAAQTHGLKFFMFGATEAQNVAACDAIKKMYPELQIVGRRNGYFKPDENDAICSEIVNSGADVLWIALGKPFQEEWCVSNKARLKGLGWLKTCGGLYAFLSGDDKRAPLWMQNAGLEWFYRACQDPRRLIWRYIKTNPHAFLTMLKPSRSGKKSVRRKR